jgi:hypothetical protein
MTYAPVLFGSGTWSGPPVGLLSYVAASDLARAQQIVKGGGTARSV